MFEVGLFELVIIFGVALIVLGPTRLPGLVSKIGRWAGKARSMARQFREQLENEVNLEELNRSTGTSKTSSYSSTPAPPPEFSGEPMPAEPTPEAEAANTTAEAPNTEDDTRHNETPDYPGYQAPEPEPPPEVVVTTTQEPSHERST
jgi:sec-independent protein translocase protein TatB